jgi:Fe-S cluster biogenesis protein NfuA
MTDANKKKMITRVDDALNDVRPHLKVDGGNVEVVDITDNHIVKIKWLGTCETCSMSMMTMKASIEETLRGKIPEVSGVEAVNGLSVG